MIKVSLLSFVTACGMMHQANAAMPPNYPCIGGACPGYPWPPRPPGFLLLDNPGAKVEVDIFGDNLCYFTGKSWPTIKALAAQYVKQPVSIRFHWFPLPYHHDAYFVGMVDHFVGTTSFNGGSRGELLFKFADAVFSNQTYFLQQAANLTEPEVQARIADFAQTAGVPTSGVQELWGNSTLYRQVDDFTRVSWKYAATRGVFETPTFFINGFPHPEPFGANTGVANTTGWAAIIDSLLSYN